MSVLSCEQMSFRYPPGGMPDRAFALKNISFSLEEGEFAALTGRTGSGKSTLLQHLNGLLVPSEGTCSYNGTDIHGPEISLKKVRQKAALCFQYPEDQLFAETVLEDICFGPLNMGYSREECQTKAREAMRLADLPPETGFLSPLSLSGGQKRRVALAGILAMEPEFLLLDEPAAGLDREGKKNLFSLLDRLNREKNMGILLVSHDMDQVAEHARRLILLDKGEILMDGSPAEIFSHAEIFRELGLGLPPAVSFYHKLREAGFAGREDRVPLTAEELTDYILCRGDFRHV